MKRQLKNLYPADRYMNEVVNYAAGVERRRRVKDNLQSQRDKLRNEAHAENPYLCDATCSHVAKEKI